MNLASRIPLIAASLALTAAMAHAQVPIFFAKWGTVGTGNGQFQYTQGMARTAAGDLWTADFGNARIQRFSKTGVWQAVIGAAYLHQPAAISLDAGENLFVADGGADAIVVLSPAGARLNEWGGTGSGNGQFHQVTGIAVDRSTGEVYATDYMNHRVQKFAHDGTYELQWGSFGTAPGKFEYPYGVAVDPTTHDVVVADMLNSRVQVFDPTGAFLFSIGGPGTGDGQFLHPVAPWVDAVGNILVCDQSNHRVEAFTGAGAFAYKFGTPGLMDGQLNLPAGIATDAQGFIYVADRNNNRVQKFGDVAVPTAETSWGRVKALYR